MTLLEYLRKIGVNLEGDLLSQGTQLLAQLGIELEAEQTIGASRYERSEDRKIYLNGHRDRIWETRVGEIPLRIPKLREGTPFPSLLEPRRRAEKALLGVVQTAYVQGVCTWKVDDLLRAMGLAGIDKSKVSRICKELDELAEGFRNRRLEGSYPYMWLDALYLKMRQDHRIVSLAMVIAIGVRETGERDVLGFSLGASEEYAFSRQDTGTVWMDLQRSLLRRGLKGVQLVISDAHEGLKAAIGETLTGTAWQRCRVHPGLVPVQALCGMCRHTSPKAANQWWLPPCARSLLSRIEKPPGSNWGKWSRPWGPGCQHRLRLCPIHRVKSPLIIGSNVLQCCRLALFPYLLFILFYRFGSSEDACFALLFETVALPLDVESGGMVKEPIENRGGQNMIVEYFTPIQEALVGSHD